MSIKISYEDAYKILDIIQKSIGDKIEENIKECTDESMNDMCERLNTKLKKKEKKPKEPKKPKEQKENPSSGLKYYYKNKDDILEQKKEYYKNNQDKRNEYQKQFYLKKKQDEYKESHGGSLDGFQGVRQKKLKSIE